VRTLRSTWLAVPMIVLALAVAAPADEDGWKLPNLNPFKSSKPAKKRVSASVSDGKKGSGSWLKMPEMPKMSTPFAQKPAANRRAAPKGPSTVDRVSTGTKNFFSKTYDVLTPWDNDKPKKPSTQTKTARKPGASAQSSWWPWSKPDEPKDVQTVNEFIALPRVRP